MNITCERKKRILIIEDEPDFAALIEYRLQRKGYETVKALDGRSGVEEAARCRPDLIVLDLMLPQITGLDVCRLIRSARPGIHVPIFILTALDSSCYVAKGFMYGADGYFIKGTQMHDLLREIDVVFMGGRPADAESVSA
ncbi:MAG: response regulator [Verrucomicrobiia bacterium]